METDFAKYNLIKNSEFSKGKHIHWSLNGRNGEKREVVPIEDINWFNIAKKEKESNYWGIAQLIDAFSPTTDYTLSFDAFSGLPEGKLQVAP